MGTTANKLSYLRETKSLLKDKIIDLGGTITDETTFEEYAEEVADLYDELPKTTGEGSQVTLKNCLGGKLEIQAKGNTTQAALPSEYQAVEYIESSGTQHIDTGLNADNKLRVWLDMQYTGFPYDNINFGAIVTSPSIIRYHMSIQSTNLKPFFNTTSYTVGTRDTNRHIIDMNPSAGIFSLDGVNTTVTSASFNVGMNFWLFGRNSDADIYHSNMKLYRCKMYYNGILVRDFIPCYKTADTTIGLYDLVNNVFYTNIGEGVFTKGNDVTIPNPDYPLDVKVATSNNIVTIGGKNLSNWESGDINSASGQDVPTANAIRTIGYIPLKYGDTISEWHNFDLGLNIRLYDANKNYLGYATFSSGLFTNTNQSAVYVRFRVSHSKSNTDKIIIAYSNVALTENDYEPYFTPIEKSLNLGTMELCKIGDYQDYIYKNNGNWYKHTNICKHDTWDVIDSKAVYSATVRPQFLLSEPTDVTNRQYTLCNYFQNQINNNDVEHIFIGTGNPGNVYNGLNVFISKSRATTDTEVINWLTNNNVVVYYVPANPVDIQITDTTLIAQLESLLDTIIPNGTIVVLTSDSNNANLQVLASTVRSKGV